MMYFDFWESQYMDIPLKRFYCPRCGEEIGDLAYTDIHKDVIACEYCADVRDYDSALVDAGDDELVVAEEYGFTDYWRIYAREAD